MCNKSKPLSDFAANKRRKDGLQSQCKDCHKEYRKKHYEKNRQKYIDKAKKLSREFADWWKEYNTGISSTS